MIVGTRLYGRTDEVEGLGYVAARFFHLNFVPLFPTGETFLVVKHSFFSERQEVVQIKNDLKPVLLGYARGAAWTAVILTSLFALLNVAYVASTGELYLGRDLPIFLAACAALALLYAPRRLRRASPERAWELAAASGVGAIEIADLLVEPQERVSKLRRLSEGAGRSQDASALDQTQEGLPTRLAAPILLAKALPTSTPNAVKFECPTCESHSKVSAEHVGKRGPCKACGIALRVPAPITKRARLVEWSYLSEDEGAERQGPRRAEVAHSRRSEVARPRRSEVARRRPPAEVLGWASSDAPLGLVG